MQTAEGCLTGDPISCEVFLSKDEEELSRYSGAGSAGGRQKSEQSWAVFSEEVGEGRMYRQVRKEDLGEEIKDFDLYPNTMGEGNEKI